MAMVRGKRLQCNELERSQACLEVTDFQPSAAPPKKTCKNERFSRVEAWKSYIYYFQLPTKQRRARFGGAAGAVCGGAVGQSSTTALPLRGEPQARRPNSIGFGESEDRLD
ncbi:MAG: hypothetical protein KatS3mg038_3622 [Candidatus Kapaibacterium sp.]|nr:MAG: hypothetical protein KatS3mg038_3622 [Candidatus Kapabacteria bacterium]